MHQHAKCRAATKKLAAAAFFQRFEEADYEVITIVSVNPEYDTKELAECFAELRKLQESYGGIVKQQEELEEMRQATQDEMNEKQARIDEILLDLKSDALPETQWSRK